MDMIAPIIKTMPMMLNTELPVVLVFCIAPYVALYDKLDVAVGSVDPGILFIVTKNAKTPTAKIISETTTPIIAPGSINPNFVFIFTKTNLNYRT